MNPFYVKNMKELQGEPSKLIAQIEDVVGQISKDEDDSIKLDAYEKIIDLLNFYWYGTLLERIDRLHLYE
jgi:hypothetical protein